MNISQYIASKDTLKNLHFCSVYQTITTLIADGKLSMNDFNPEPLKVDEKSEKFCSV